MHADSIVRCEYEQCCPVYTFTTSTAQPPPPLTSYLSLVAQFPHISPLPAAVSYSSPSSTSSHQADQTHDSPTSHTLVFLPHIIQRPKRLPTLHQLKEFSIVNPRMPPPLPILKLLARNQHITTMCMLRAIRCPRPLVASSSLSASTNSRTSS
ncbi:hypothetical protein BGX38DRAFT_1189761 [Terfezia claveryi]|nr:hypothetical protein BGX38DRAFT_1189761 [Terfezia claveryi]